MANSRRNIVVKLFAFFFIFGSLNAVPSYGENFDETKYQHYSNNEDFNVHKSFDSGVGTGQSRGFFLHQSFPFFGPDVFKTFSGFGIEGDSPDQPWYKGVNVCENFNTEENNSSSEEMSAENPENSDAVAVKLPTYGQFHFSVNSCVEKPNKYVCTRIINKNGKKTNLTVIRQCCHGYGRPRNADFVTPCEKIDVKNFNETLFVIIGKGNADLNNTLSKGNITTFMPIDKAFAGYYDQRNSETNSVISKPDEAAMKKLFQSHIVDGEISLYDLSNDNVLNTQNGDQTIRINLYQMPATLGPESFHYTANCMSIENHDENSEQGLVHTIDGVLKPVTKNVMDLIRERSELSIMRTLLEKNKINEILQSEKPVTIFVPNDYAFEKLEPHFRRVLEEGKSCVTNILKNHIFDLTFCSAASIVGAMTTVYNILGEPIRFNRSKISSEKTTKSVMMKNPPIIINGISRIVEADIMGTNGVLHVIDTILPTKTALPLSTLLKEKNLTLFMRLVEAAGLDTSFDDMVNVTVFAPTDKALQGTEWIEKLYNTPVKLSKNSELVDFLNYHISKPMIKTCDLLEQQIPTLANSKVRINLYSSHALFSNVMNRATVNCARLVRFDDESCGSVLHQIDKALIKPQKTLLELLESNPNYSKFFKLLQLNNLTYILSKVDKSYTLFIPKNDVFDDVEDWEHILIKDKNGLENLLKTHIINDVVCCAGIIPTNWPFVRSIESVNGVHLRITRDRRPKVENAGITKCDNIAINGVIHEINDVIIDPSILSQNRLYQSPEHIVESGAFF